VEIDSFGDLSVASSLKAPPRSIHSDAQEQVQARRISYEQERDIQAAREVVASLQKEGVLNKPIQRKPSWVEVHTRIAGF